MGRKGLEKLSELLEGYCEPERKKWAVNGNAIGHTGLTTRVHTITYLDGVIAGMLRPKHYKQASQIFGHIYLPILQMAKSSWATEFLRVMDRARSQGEENLTVELFHERFQNEPAIDHEQRRLEQASFDGLIQKYNATDARRFRNKGWFHLDLEHNLRPPSNGIADVHELTSALLLWYKFVATIVFDAEPRYVTVEASERAVGFVRELRHMMASRRRLRRMKHLRTN